MIDIQRVVCFNTRSPILHLFLPIQCQIHNIVVAVDGYLSPSAQRPLMDILGRVDIEYKG